MFYYVLFFLHHTAYSETHPPSHPLSLHYALPISPLRSLRYRSLGDSYTIGEGVAPAYRWPVQLAHALRAEGVMLGDPKIIATTGWTTDELSAALDVFDAGKDPAGEALVGAASAASSSARIEIGRAHV